MFNNCDFILGDDDSIVIVVPTRLPKDLPLTIEVHERTIIFKSGRKEIGDIFCNNKDILQRLMNKASVGMIELLNGIPKFPTYIAAVAEIKVMATA